MKDINNFTEKKITEFNQNDSVYMQKNRSGFTYTFLVRFKSFSKGNITGEILDIQPNNQKSIWIGKEFLKIGSELTGKISKCYTFKTGSGSGCRWFKKISNEWACS